MFDDDDHKMMFGLASLLAVVIIVCVSINVGTQHGCKIDAIAAGMKAQEVQEACK